MNGWLNGTMRATTPSGSRTEKFTASGPIGIEAPFISVTSPAKKSICAAAFSASACISCTGLPPSAASRKASSPRAAQDRRDLAEHLRTLGGMHLAPFEITAPGRLHHGVDILEPGFRDVADHLTRRRARHIGAAARYGGVPRAAVEQITLLRENRIQGQFVRHGNSPLRPAARRVRGMAPEKPARPGP